MDLEFRQGISRCGVVTEESFNLLRATRFASSSIRAIAGTWALRRQNLSR
jgi:hypothetical protein